MKECRKKKYLKYSYALTAAVKMHKKYHEVQTPYYCRKCDAHHLTMKRADRKELAERLLYRKGIVLAITK